MATSRLPRLPTVKIQPGIHIGSGIVQRILKNTDSLRYRKCGKVVVGCHNLGGVRARTRLGTFSSLNVAKFHVCIRWKHGALQQVTAATSWAWNLTVHASQYPYPVIRQCFHVLARETLILVACPPLAMGVSATLYPLVPTSSRRQWRPRHSRAIRATTTVHYGHVAMHYYSKDLPYRKKASRITLSCLSTQRAPIFGFRITLLPELRVHSTCPTYIRPHAVARRAQSIKWCMLRVVVRRPAWWKTLWWVASYHVEHVIDTCRQPLSSALISFIQTNGACGPIYSRSIGIAPQPTYCALRGSITI